MRAICTHYFPVPLIGQEFGKCTCECVRMRVCILLIYLRLCYHKMLDCPQPM